MCIFLAMGGNSTTWMNTAVLVTCIRNFRKNRGPVSGILKGYVGLSTAIFTDLCAALFSSRPAPFLLMLAVVPAAACLIAMLFLREVDAGSPTATGNTNEESRYFAVFNALAIIVAVYLLVFNVTGHHSAAVSRAFAGVLLFLLVSPAAIPFYAAGLSRRPPPASSDEEARHKAMPSTPSSDKEDGPHEEAHGPGPDMEGDGLEKKRPMIGEDHGIFQTVRTVDFWCLFMSFLCGVGPGMAVMNNMGQMGLALGHADVSVFVSLMSIWGFFGRIGSGTTSEYFLK